MNLCESLTENLFVESRLVELKELSGIPGRKGMEKALISNGKIVNVVSKSYAHIPNEIFFYEAEAKLIDAGFDYKLKTINRDDRSFSADFIITNKESFTVKKGHDEIKPLLRFVNSYDGTQKTSGSFGFYRELCSNGLYLAETKVDFSLKHTKKGAAILMPSMNSLMNNFLENEFFSFKEHFENLSLIQIDDLEKVVKKIADQTNLFKFESSDSNPAPSKKSRDLIEIVNNEANILNQKPNLWLVYNAFNETIHKGMKKGYSQQVKADKHVFNTILEIAN